MSEAEEQAKEYIEKLKDRNIIYKDLKPNDIEIIETAFIFGFWQGHDYGLLKLKEKRNGD